MDTAIRRTPQHEHAKKSAEQTQFEVGSIGAKAQCHKDLSLEKSKAVAPEQTQFGNLSRGEALWEGRPGLLAAAAESG